MCVCVCIYIYSTEEEILDHIPKPRCFRFCRNSSNRSGREKSVPDLGRADTRLQGLGLGRRVCGCAASELVKDRKVKE